MAHSMIIGQTESGKSTLAVNIARHLRRKRQKVLVLDAIRDPRWPAHFITDKREEFTRIAKNNRSCFLFCDEAGEYVGQWDDEMHWLGTRSRHWGHSCTFISQRVQQIAPLVRDQCSTLYLFNCSTRDAKILAEEWGWEDILIAPKQKQGTCLKIQRYEPPKQLHLNFPSAIERSRI